MKPTPDIKVDRSFCSRLQNIFFLAFCGLFLLPSVGQAKKKASSTQQISASSVKLYALVYGTSLYPTRYMVARRLKKQRISFAWMFYLLVWKKRRILIDTGIHSSRWRRHFGIQNYRSPVSLLRSSGLRTNQITDIILTHRHPDHVDALPLFPKARVILHKANASALLRSSNQALRRFARKLQVSGRLWKVGKKQSVFSWLSVEHTGGHTSGSQAVWLRVGKRKAVFTGDECYMVRFCRKAWGLPSVSLSSRFRNHRFLRRLQRLHLLQKWSIFTHHDPAILKRGKVLAPGVIRLW